MASASKSATGNGGADSDTVLLALSDSIDPAVESLIGGHVNHFAGDPAHAAAVMDEVCSILMRADPATLAALSEAYADDALSG